MSKPVLYYYIFIYNIKLEKRKKINRLKARKRNVNSGLNNGLNCESDVF